MRVVDLSFPIRPHFRWKVARDVQRTHARGDLFESSTMPLPCGSPVRAIALVD